MMKKNFVIPILLVLFVIIFSYPFSLHARLPIPSDTIIGLYHPFRDLYAKQYPNGIPYKNFLITDPVRQLYPWRELAVSLEKQLQLPLWNPYSFAGSPLLANFQTAAFYPLNILLFILPFWFGWSILVILQPLLAGLFLYFYLRRMKLSEIPSLLGGIVFAFCGFATAWFEWNTLGQVALWLPLILLAKEHILEKFSYKWVSVLIFAECAALFAGHIQTFFYMILLFESYLVFRIIQITYSEKTKNYFWKRAWIKLYPFIVPGLIIIAITSIQWLPTLQFIDLSARGADQMSNWQQPGWFIPWQNLVQFLAPDFFGNPATLNYWGVWNYGEFIGYIGIFPLLMALFALFYRRDKKTFFFTAFFFLSLIFSLPTIFAKIPYLLQIPFLSTSQPTRLLFLADFSLAILAALGLDFFLQVSNKKKFLYPLGFLLVTLAGLWVFVLFGYKSFQISVENISVAKHNLYLPSLFVGIVAILISAVIFIKNKKVTQAIIILLVLLSFIDLFRLSDKFNPYTNRQYLFPQTASLSFLQSQKGQFRVMTTDSQTMPPNFSVMYHLQSLDGYDPLYLQRYGELIAAIARNKPDIHTPFGFNRIITPTDSISPLIDLFGVKYVLSLSDIHEPKLTKVFTEGQMQIYENKSAFPRVFFVNSIKFASDKNAAIQLLFNKKNDFHTTAIVENGDLPTSSFASGSAIIDNYQENSVSISTKSSGEGFLVLTDIFYPTWHVTVDGKEEKIYRTDYTFRGVIVPAGNHHIIFYDSLL